MTTSTCSSLRVVVCLIFCSLVTRCESEGYCRFPSFLWRRAGTLDDSTDDGVTYRKWFSRTEYSHNTHTWTRQKEIHVLETEIVIYQRLYATCTGYEHSDDVPCFRQTRETRLVCVAEEPDGKYRVQQRTEGSSPSFSCLQFVRRTDFITQILSAAPNDVNVDKLCYDVALQREEWPWIDIHHAPITSCPFTGGFDFRAYTGNSRREKCPVEWRPARLESECINGEGIQLTFPSQDCSFLYKGVTERTLLCRGDWAEESYRFVVLSDTGGHPRYVLRLPVTLDQQPRHSLMFAYLYFSLAVPASSRGQPPGNTFYMQLRMTRSGSELCYDESPECERYAKDGRCRDSPIYQFANHCKRSCGLCDFVPSAVPECKFPSHFQGNWSLVTEDGMERVSVSGGTIGLTSLGSFACKTKHWDMDYYKVLSVFHNGCRPRYNCVQLLPLGQNMLQLRISNSSLEDKSFEICEFEEDSSHWKSALLNSELKTLFNTDTLSSSFCGLGGIFHTNVSFSDGSSCQGTLRDLDHVTCTVHGQLRVDLRTCALRELHDYICVAFTQLPHGTSFLATRAVSKYSSEKYKCWVIKQGGHHLPELPRARVLQFNRAKCSTAEIISLDPRRKEIVAMETFNDIVESACDGSRGVMNQGSTGLASPVSYPPYNIERYDDYWARSQQDAGNKEQSPAAVKRTTPAGSEANSLTVTTYCSWICHISSLLFVNSFYKGYV